MSSEWQRVALDELYEFSSGLSKPRSAFGSGYPFLSFKDVFYNSAVPKQLTELVNSTWQERERCSVIRGDVFLTRTSETMDELGMSSVALTDIPDATFNGFTKRLRPKHSQRVAPEFARYYFRSPEFRSGVTAMASMSTRASLNNEMLSRLCIVLPSHAEQERIGQALGCLDDRIALLRETNKTIHSIAQAIFKSWFVDFDPVRAKMDDRQPEGMDEVTAALFPDSFEESGLGLIPTHWSARSFHEMIRVIGGGTPKTSNPDYWGGHIPWYSVVDVPSGADTFVLNTEKKITQAGLAESSTKLLPFGTTIISARGTVGKLALTGCEMAMNQSCYGLRGQNNDIYFTYFSTQRLVEHLKQQAHGSVFDTITTATFKGVRVVSPPPSIIARFETNVEVLMERMLVNLKTLTSLAQLRDTLLPRLISGQIRFPEAQEQIENALS